MTSSNFHVLSLEVYLTYIYKAGVKEIRYYQIKSKGYSISKFWSFYKEQTVIFYDGLCPHFTKYPIIDLFKKAALLNLVRI